MCQWSSFVSTSPNRISRPPAPQGQGLPLRRPVSLLPMSRAQTSSPQASLGTCRAVAGSPPLHPSQRGGGPHPGRPPGAPLPGSRGSLQPGPPSRPLTGWRGRKNLPAICSAAGFPDRAEPGDTRRTCSPGEVPLAPAVRRTERPRDDHWDPRVPTEECWSSRFLGPSQWCPAAVWTCPVPKGPQAPEARELGHRAPGSN